MSDRLGRVGLEHNAGKQHTDCLNRSSGEVRQSMCTMADPMSAPEALAKLQTLAGDLADVDAAELPAEALGQYIRELVQADGVLAAALASMLAAYDVKDGHLARWSAVAGGLAGAHGPGDPGPGRGVQGDAGPAPGPRAAAGRAPRPGAHQVRRAAAGQVDPGHPGRVPDPGRGDPCRRRAGGGGLAGAGADLRGDPVPDRPAGPRRP